MPRKKVDKRKRKATGIEAIVEPRVGALYSRGAWMKKLDYLDKGKSKRIKKNKVRRKQR